VQVGNLVVHVHVDGRALPVVESELNLRLRLALVDDGLATRSRCVDSSSLGGSSAAHARSFARETDILGRGRRCVLLAAAVLEANLDAAWVLVADFLWYDSLLQLFNKLLIRFVYKVAEGSIFAHLEAVAPEDDLQISHAFWAVAV